MNITLCEQCFPDWGTHEILTIVPIGPCCQCGRYDERRTQGVVCHIFRGDPRKAMRGDKVKEIGDDS